MAGKDGAELANPFDIVEAQIQASFASLVPDVRRRWSLVRTLGTAPFAFAAVLALWATGYPGWRVAVVAADMAGFLILLPRISRVLTSGPSPSAREGVAWPLLLDSALVVVVVALTGGMHSPFVVGVPASLVTLYVGRGWSATTRVVAALYGTGLVLSTIAPQRLFGPRVDTPVFEFLVLGAIVGSLVINIGVITVLKGAMEASRTALGNAREQLLGQLCQRTRDMEKVGASLSHELKNPLQAIKILVQLSAREVREPEARERLQVAEGEVERMQALIKDYLSFSRPFDKLQPHPVDLGSLSDEVIGVLRERAAACGISLERRGDARVEADARRLREALHNLVSNAVDASPRGGSIRIEISEAVGAARIVVRDSGRGMSPETLERIGTPFFTTREEGTGLGVAAGARGVRAARRIARIPEQTGGRHDGDGDTTEEEGERWRASWSLTTSLRCSSRSRSCSNRAATWRSLRAPPRRRFRISTASMP